MSLRVRYYSHMALPTGFGRCALDYALALTRHTDVVLDIRLLAPRGSGRFLYPAEVLTGRAAELGGCVNLLPDHLPPDVTLVHTMPADCHATVSIESDAGGLNLWETTLVAYTTWEAQTLPRSAVDGLEPFYRVLTPSHYSQRAIARGFRDHLQSDLKISRAADRQGDCPPVAIVPHAFDFDLPELAAARAARAERVVSENAKMLGPALALAPPTPYTFYYVGAWNERKNVDGLIRAFAYAFPEPEPRSSFLQVVAPTVPAVLPRLILHCPRTDQRRYIRAIAATGDARIQKRIFFSSDILPDEEIWKIHAHGDCFVSASRGEAWNMGAFEAMASGAYVITPDGQGSDDFLGATTADICTTELEPTIQDVELEDRGGGVAATVKGPKDLTARQLWLEPSITSLASAMRRAAAERAVITTEYDVAARYGYAAIGKQLLTELETAHGI